MEATASGEQSKTQKETGLAAKRAKNGEEEAKRQDEASKRKQKSGRARKARQEPSFDAGIFEAFRVH